MAGGKIDILVEPDTRGFDGKLESGLQGGLGAAKNFAAQIGLLFGAAELAKGVVGLGVQFESQMNTMSAVSQATGSQLDAVAAKARELGNDTSLTATSATDAAAAMTELAKGGFSVEQSMDAAKGTLQLAAAAQIDAATAATIQAQALQSFSLGAEDAARVSDILAGAANASSAEIEGIAQGLQQSGTVASQFGLTIEDTATALSMFANAGIQGSDAGTLLKSALLALTDQGKPAQAAMEELGLSVYDMQGNFVGLPSLFEQLAAAQSEMTPEAYQAATATLFGSDAMRLAGIAADQGRGGFENLRDAVTRQGQAAEVAAAQTKGLPGALERVQNAAEEAGLAVYSALSDELVAGVDAATAAIEGLGPVVAAGFETALGVIGPVASGIGDVASAASGLIGPAAGMATAIGMAKWADLPNKLDAGSSALRGFGGHMRVQQKLAERMGKEIGVMGSALSVLESRSPAVAGMASAFRDASSPALMLGKNTKRTAEDLSGMARVSQMAKGNVQQFGGVLSGVAHGGMSALKSGASGLVSFLGGPWGLAFAAAGLAIGALVQSHQEAAQAELEHKQRQAELRDTLDDTTGSITAQTEALMLKRAEEAGWSQTATELGISQGTLAQAMQGNARAIGEVDAAVAASNASAIRGSDFWGKYGASLDAAGVSAADMGAAMAGNEDAARRVNKALHDIDAENKGVFSAGEWSTLQHELEETTQDANDLRDGVKGAADELDEVQTEQARQQLLALEKSLEDTGKASKLLGDNILAIPDHKTVRVESDSLTEETRAKLKEMGAEVHDLNGVATVTFPEGLNIIKMLDEMGVKLQLLEGGRLTVEENTPEVMAALDMLGIAANDIDGTLHIDLDDDATRQRLIDLGLAAEIDGEFRLNDNIQDVLDRIAGIPPKTESDHQVHDNVDATKQKIDGLNSADTGAGHTQTDNVPATKANIDELNNRDTSSTHTVITRRVEYWVSQGYSQEQAGRIQGPVPINNTGGRFPAYAAGDRHSGYRLPGSGPGTQITDGFLALDMYGMPVARLDAREWVINGDSSEAYHQLLRGINADTPRARAAMAAYESMPGYAEGRNPRGDDDRDTGRAARDEEASDEDDRDDVESGVDRAFRELGHRTGQAYQWGGASIGATDCSGEVGLWQVALQDLTPRDQRLGNTTSLLAGGWPDLVPGTAGTFIVGTTSAHMVAQLDGTNIESGGSGVQIGSGATSPFSLAGATLYYLPDDKIVGGTGSGKSSSRSSGGDDGKSDAERERERLDEMAAESQPRLATSNTQLPPDPVASALLTPVNDPDGVKAISRAGQHTDRFELAHNAGAEDLLTEFLLWAYGSEDEPDQELARAFNETNDPTGIRSMVEAGVWTGRFGNHYRAGKDSQLVKAIHAARINGGYQTIRLRELQDEYDSKPASPSEFVGKHVGNAAESITADVLGAIGHDDEFGPIVELGMLLGKRAAKTEQGIDGSGRIVIEDTTRTREPSTAPSGVSESEAEEIQPTGSEVYDPARGTEQWSGEILRALQITGNPSSWSQPMTEQGDLESGGNPDAVGPDSPEGPPEGVWQVKRATYDAFRDPNLVNDVRDVLSNGVAALRYVNSEYDTLPWPTAAGYQTGGPVHPGKRGGRGPRDKIPIWAEDGEFVVNAQAARDNEAVLTAINEGHRVADVMADAVVSGGTMAADLGLQGGAALARTAAQSMGPQGMALLPFIEAAESMGGMAIDRLSELAYQLSDDVVDGAAGSVAQFVGVGGPSTRMDIAASRVPATAGAQQAGAAAPVNATQIDVNTRGYDRRDLVAGIRQATTIQRWKEGL